MITSQVSEKLVAQRYDFVVCVHHGADERCRFLFPPPPPPPQYLANFVNFVAAIAAIAIAISCCYFLALHE
jgi:hypothetical protein